MFTQKSFVVSLMLFAMVFLMSGCVDLFAVPGVAVSPDGSQIYVLGAQFATDGSSSSASEISGLLSIATSGGASTVVMDTTGGATPSAFAVNPSTGDLAYVLSRDDGTSTEIMLYNQAAGSRALVANGAFPGAGAGTMMTFSPDGSKLALSMMLLPPDVALAGDAELTPEQLQQIDSVLYLVDVNTGQVKPISDPAAQWVNTFDWSPSGNLLAYNAWVDTNADGTISISGGFDSMMSMDASATGTSDLSQVFIHDVNAGSSTPVQSTLLSFGPEFLSDNALAYLTLDTAMLMFGAGGTVQVYDLGSSTSTSVYQSAGMIVGLAVSPDGSQVAWGETNASSGSMSMGTEESSTAAPNYLYVADTSFSSPRQVAVLDGTLGYPDIPVWMPNGQQLLVSTTNPLSTIIGSFSGMMGGMSEAFGDMSELTGTPIAPEEVLEELPQQQILMVDVASGTTTPVFTGAMTNSSLYASIIGTVSSTDMSGMMEGFGDQ